MTKRLAFILLILIVLAGACRFTPQLPWEPTAAPVSAETDVAQRVQQTVQALQGQPTPAPQETAGVTPAPGEASGGSPSIPTVTPKAPVKPANAALLQVIYTYNGNLFRWKPGETSVQLTQHGDAQALKISPDGIWVAYTRGEPNRANSIWAIRSDGKGDHELVSPADLPAPSPDAVLVPDQLEFQPGTHILYYNTLTAVNMSAPSYDLRRVNLDSGDKATLLPEKAGGKIYFSPDGKKVLLARNDSFTVANPDGSDARQVFTYPWVMTYSEWAYLPDPVWSKDSKSFRVIIPPQDPLKNPEDASFIWQVPVDGSAASQLWSFVAVPAFESRPLLSPDGTRVAFQTRKPGTDTLTDLMIAAADGSSSFAARSGNLTFRSWGPDSQRFVVWFPSLNEVQVGGIDGIFLGWPVGIKPGELTWVDAKYALILSGSRDAPELWLVQLGGRAVKIASSPNPNLSFDFTK